jgi:hypothetical protein
VAAAVALLAAVTMWMSREQPRSEISAAGESTMAAAETASAQTLLGAVTVPEFRVELVLGEERVNE